VRALVAYGTKYGSTAKVAEAIAAELGPNGYEVDLADLREKYRGDLGRYDLVVLGSSVFVGKWTRGAQDFLHRNREALAGKRVALFVCCSDALFPEKVDNARKLYLEEVAEANSLAPTAMGLFGGEVDFRKYGMFTKLMVTKVGAKEQLERKGMDASKPFDFRDWSAIRGWARAL